MKLHKRGDGNAVETAPLEDSKPKSRKKSQQSVIVYVTLLFTFACLLVLLSYFMQQRKNEDAMSDLTEQHTQFTAQAQQNIENLQNMNIDLQTQLEEAQEKIQELESKVDELNAENESVKAELEEAKELEQTLRDSRSADEKLALLFAAIAGGNDENIKNAFDNMSGCIEYLDAAYAELYEGILEHPEIYGLDSELVEEPLRIWREHFPKITD